MTDAAIERTIAAFERNRLEPPGDDPAIEAFFNDPDYREIVRDVWRALYEIKVAFEQRFGFDADELEMPWNWADAFHVEE